MKKVRIAINGFGRIGRAAFKIALANKNTEIVAINDLTENEMLAYLLRHDSVYGNYEKKVTATKEALFVNGKKIPSSAIADPARLPWKKLKVDVVLECTGVFETEGADKHLLAGARQVIISAPTKNEKIGTYVLGGNMETYSKTKNNRVISMASCTTNCITPVMKVLDQAFGVERALLTTVHSYTSTQNLVDGPSKKPDRARAAALNMIPTTTGAAIATTKTLPQLAEKFDGLAVRVPTPCGSLSDITALLRKEVTVEQINRAFHLAAKKVEFKNILEVSDEFLVSTDILKNSHSAIVQTGLTTVVGGDLVKIMAWYDNEWGYSTRLIDTAIALGKK